MCRHLVVGAGDRRGEFLREQEAAARRGLCFCRACDLHLSSARRVSFAGYELGLSANPSAVLVAHNRQTVSGLLHICPRNVWDINSESSSSSLPPVRPWFLAAGLLFAVFGALALVSEIEQPSGFSVW